MSSTWSLSEVLLEVTADGMIANYFWLEGGADATQPHK